MIRFSTIFHYGDEDDVLPTLQEILVKNAIITSRGKQMVDDEYCVISLKEEICSSKV